MPMPVRGSVIESLGTYLPARVLSTDEVLSRCDRMPWFQRRNGTVARITGIRRRRVADDHEGSAELAANAMAQCFALSRHVPSEIELLVYCSISRTERSSGDGFVIPVEPSISVGLSERLGLSRAFAFDIGNGCAGMFTAIQVVDALIRAGIIRVGMVVSGEHITSVLATAQKEVTEYSDPRFASLTLGDAGVALVLAPAPDEHAGFHDIDLYTVGRYSDYCVAKPTREPHGGPIMHTESAKLFAVATQYGTRDIVQALGAVGWGGDPFHFIMHQTAQAAFDAARQSVNAASGREVLHRGNVINNLTERGNTATTTHFVALWDSIVSGRIRSGERVFFSIQGAGLTFGTAPYTLDDLPARIQGAADVDADTRRPAAGSPPARPFCHAASSGVRIESIATAAPVAAETGLELACAAIERCLERSSHLKEEIELLVYAGIHRDEFLFEPALAAVIAGRVGLNDPGTSAGGKKALAFDLVNGAIGFLNACYVAAAMIRSGRVKVAMVVAAEVESVAGGAEGERRGIRPAGSAVILDASPDGVEGFGPFAFGRFPEHAAALSSKVVFCAGSAGLRHERSAELESVYLRCIPEVVATLLDGAGVAAREISLVLAPQISPGFSHCLGRLLDLPIERFVDGPAGVGDLASSTLPATFLETGRTRTPRPGDLGLVVNVGSGIQVGAALYRYGSRLS